MTSNQLPGPLNGPEVSYLKKIFRFVQDDVSIEFLEIH